MSRVGEEKRSNHYAFDYWHAPSAQAVGGSATEFLHKLKGPTHVFIPGRDPSRCRAVVTLQHGNEPSGFIGLYHLIRKQIKPAVDLHCFIASVAAAQRAPGFFYRMLPGEDDLNRCFKSPYGDSAQSRLAKGLLDTLGQFQPEAIIDVHNTSGSGPAFGVTTFMDPRHEALVSLFTHRIIVTDLSLGALMEISEVRFPTVTVECGGAQDLEAHRLAEEGLIEFARRDDVLTPPPADFALEFFYNPMRLELRQGASICYRDSPSPEHDVTLPPQVEHLNFGFVDAGISLGFVGTDMPSVLSARDSHGAEMLERFFIEKEGRLLAREQLKLFMVTTNAEIARTDCLFYFVPASDSLSVVQSYA